MLKLANKALEYIFQGFFILFCFLFLGIILAGDLFDKLTFRLKQGENRLIK